MKHRPLVFRLRNEPMRIYLQKQGEPTEWCALLCGVLYGFTNWPAALDAALLWSHAHGYKKQ
jgi:hypothetical protein